MDFVGRERELATLSQAWEAARKNQQVVVLIGESRFGKTRIAHEFYTWLNRHEDPNDYWPDSLPAGKDSLEVNPVFGEHHAAADTVPPWLWWGLRWTQPYRRNPSEVSGCAVLDAGDKLKPHLESIQAKLAARDAPLKVAETLASLNPLVHAALSIKELIETWHQVRERGTPRAITETRTALAGNQLDTLYDLLFALITSDAVVSGGLPFILVLDDVHWADADSLRFIQRLLRACAELASDGGRKPPRILVIATAWEREWNEACDAPLTATADTAPVSFSELLRALLEQPQSFEAQDWHALAVTECRLGRMDESLHPNIRKALPGLTARQVALVAERAGGSPGFLQELLLALQDNRLLFEREDTSRALTASGEKELRDMRVEYHDLVEKRLRKLDAAESAVLRLASYAGLSYSRDFIAALAQCAGEHCAGIATPAGAEQAMDRANHPLAIVQAVAQRMDEFRLPLYRDILKRQLDVSEGLRQCVNDQVPRLLRQWLVPERLAAMGREERGAFLSFAAGELTERLKAQAATPGAAPPADESLRLPLLRALAEQIGDLLGEGRPRLVQALFNQWLQVWRSGHSPPDLLTLADVLIDLLNAAFLIDQPAAAETIANAYIADAPTPPPTTEAASLFCCMLCFAGDAARVSDQLSQALALYQKAQNTAQESLDTHGENAQRLRDVSVSQEKVADVLRDQDRVEEALKLYNDSLQTRERIVAEFGENAERLRDRAVSLLRVGEALAALKQPAEALAHLRPALGILQGIARDFGMNNQRRNDVAYVTKRIAAIERALGG